MSKVSYHTLRKFQEIPTADRKKILRWIGQGVDVIELFRQYTVSLHSAHRIWSQYKTEVPTRKPAGRYPRIPDETRAAILADYAARLPMDEIEEKYNVHRCTVWEIRRSNPNVPTRSRTVHNRHTGSAPKGHFSPKRYYIGV